MNKKHLITTVLVMTGLFASTVPTYASEALVINAIANLFWIWID